MTFPKTPEPRCWRDVSQPETQKRGELIDADDEALDEDAETEIEADFEDTSILNALTNLAHELDEALLEVDDDAGIEKRAAAAP